MRLVVEVDISYYGNGAIGNAFERVVELMNSLPEHGVPPQASLPRLLENHPEEQRMVLAESMPDEFDATDIDHCYARLIVDRETFDPVCASKSQAMRHDGDVVMIHKDGKEEQL